jgi:hypothetical protein
MDYGFPSDELKRRLYGELADKAGLPGPVGEPLPGPVPSVAPPPQPRQFDLNNLTTGDIVQILQAQRQPKPEDYAEYRAADAQDQEATRKQNALASIRAATNQIVNRRWVDPEAPAPVNEAVRQYLVKKQMTAAPDFGKLLGDAQTMVKLQNEGLKLNAETGKVVEDTRKTRAEIPGVQADTQAKVAMQQPLAAEHLQMLAKSGLPVPPGTTYAQAKDLVDQYAKGQNIQIDWGKLALDRDKFAFDKTKEATNGKAADEAAKRNLGADFELDPNAPHPPSSVRDAFITKTQAATAIRDNINRLRGLFAKGNQGAEWSGADAAAMKSAATMIQMGLKSTLGLGVLSGPDLELLEGLVANPTGIWTVIKDNAGSARLKSQLDSLEAMTVAGVKSDAAALGGKPKAGGKYAEPAGASTSQYVEIRETADGKRIGKKADGTLEIIQ